jgi:Ca2+-transporting ATPase
MNIPNQLEQKSHSAWVILCLAGKKFLQIDGIQWAGAFAFDAFFSLFPLLVLLVTVASFFVDQERAGTVVVTYMENYLPISAEMESHISATIAGVIEVREKAGAIAFLVLLWGALQCFTTLIIATNRAWGAVSYNWWRLPLRSLLLLSITASGALLGIIAPVLAKMTRDWLFPANYFRTWISTLGGVLIPLLVVYLSLDLFYRLAPRRPTRFAEVRAAALGATGLLLAAENLFVLYLNNFATLNAVYGTFGGIMALLLWIYLTGCIFIFGACLCAAQAESHAAAAKTVLTR